MKSWLEKWQKRLEPLPWYRFGTVLAEGYFQHEVGKSAAALAYYLLFSFFPFLIFISTLVGFLNLQSLALAPELRALLPQQVLDLAQAYLSHVTQLRSGNLLALSLLFSIWLPMRAVDSLMKSVNTAYRLKDPRPTLRHQAAVLFFTLCLMASIFLSLVLMLAGRRFLTLLAQFFPWVSAFIDLWNILRFPLLAVVLFLLLGFLYWVAPGVTGPKRRVFPGAVAALVSWLVFSLGFSFYVETVADYSLLYGSIGGLIVLLLWLYASATVLIMGAEVNYALAQVPLFPPK